MRILMGTYALSAGYYDAYYKRAQQVLQSLCYVFSFIGCDLFLNLVKIIWWPGVTPILELLVCFNFIMLNKNRKSDRCTWYQGNHRLI
jgi:hypothetical protein